MSVEAKRAADPAADQDDKSQTQDTSVRERRMRTLTEGGEQAYHETIDKYNIKFSTAKRKLDYELEKCKSVPNAREELTELQNSIKETCDTFEKVCGEFVDYLQRTNTAESLVELDGVREARTKTIAIVKISLTEIVDKIKLLHDDKPIVAKRTPSHRSLRLDRKSVTKRSTRSSTDSSSSSILLRQRAKAEAAKARLQFIEKKAELQKEMTLLDAKCDLAIAEAELKGIHDEIDCFESAESDVASESSEIAAERTRQFVIDQFDSSHDNDTGLHFDTQVDSQPDDVKENETGDQNIKVTQSRGQGIVKPKTDDRTTKPDYSNRNREKSSDRNNNIQDISKYLMKKELVISRISAFDDKPESYVSWKSTFCAVMAEIGANPSEEIDLLVKWLGPESSRHARSLKISNASDHKRALTKIWSRLEERYGSAEMIETSLKRKLTNFGKITHKDKRRLYDLSDILAEIQSVKENPQYAPQLSSYDSSSDIKPIVTKLPFDMQNKWRDCATRYKKDHGVLFPPFHYFVNFIQDLATKHNDPGFIYETDGSSSGASRSDNKSTGAGSSVLVRKTTVTDQQKDGQKNSRKTRCVIHKAHHPLRECREFKSLTIDEKRKLLSENHICFKCCNSAEHQRRNCPEVVKCSECGSSHHLTVMHFIPKPAEQHGGERSDSTLAKIPHDIKTMCTEVCHDQFRGKSCAKIVLVTVSHSSCPEKEIRTYAILDDQATHSLARTELFDKFGIQSEQKPYDLKSCAGTVVMSGRISDGFTVESLDSSTHMDLPSVIECEEIPGDRDEIPTPSVARKHEHMEAIANDIPPLDESSEILLLLGRDVPEAHHVLDQRLGPWKAPFAQRMRLGWVIVGDVCLRGYHAPDVVNVMKTHILPNGRGSILTPCASKLEIDSADFFSVDAKCHLFVKEDDALSSTVFEKTKADDKVGLSVEDREFLELMDEQFHKDHSGNWCAPLPFKTLRKRLPNNKSLARHRAKSLDRSLRSDPVKRDHFVAFMRKLLDNNHAELAPPLDNDEECWYLPLFGIYHPKKRDQIRCVFDASAKYEDVSLNDVLLSGPDLVNSLLAVLMRFRKERVAVTADIQQMFYCFTVREDHRNFLRFLWYRDNEVGQELVEYRIRVHVFGNSPSPAVAAYGLRKSADVAESWYGSDVKEFIQRSFYVDDALVSMSNSSDAISLLQRTQEALMTTGNLRLHKFASNSEDVMLALSPDDLAKDLKDLDFDSDHLPLQRSLGVHWDLSSDSFTFRIATGEKPYTRRGILATVHSVYDPLGFIAPVTIEGRLILRKVTSATVGWDEPLTSECETEWERWRDSLTSLDTLQIPRMYVSASPCEAARRELHVFADASEKAIAAVAYLRTVSSNGDSDLGFMFGKTKVAPSHGHTIPRLELCAGLLAVEIKDFVVENCDIDFDEVKLYTDSKVVLGYIHNRTRRFYVYVANRIERILKSTTADQWNYVPTSVNPADEGTRSVPADQIGISAWLNGPRQFLDRTSSGSQENHTLVDPEEDKELRPVSVLKTSVAGSAAIGTHRFERFSEWRRLVKAVAFLKGLVRRRQGTCIDDTASQRLVIHQDAELFIIRSVQHEAYGPEISSIKQSMCLPKDSSIRTLNPFLDDDGVLRVGGRINNSEIGALEKNPLLLPGKHHVSKLIVRHFHAEVQHQGRSFTEGAVRSAGFWITGGKKLVSSIIHKCVPCRKMRGQLEHQKMSDLPQDRLEVAPPFTNVGVDTFGPWTVVSRRTRGGSSSSKRWAIMFTCLVTRAVHIEVVDEMSSAAFINALRRFVALRGKVKVFRSDRGTNFIGATDDLRIDTINVEDGPVKNFLYNSGTVWIFNPPHASHMGGVWERMIGVTRKILDSMMSNASDRTFTHDVLCTFMAEVCAIINNRPIGSCVHRSGKPVCLISCDTSHAENQHGQSREYSRRLLSEGSLQVVMEKSTGSCRYVLGQMAQRILTCSAD